MDGQTYVITLPGRTGGHAPPQVLLVRSTGDRDAHGNAIFADASGRVRVLITGSVAHVLDGPDRGQCLTAQLRP